jgi:hypothetical protein
MMRVYGHVRRKALEVAAEVLEAPFPIGKSADEDGAEASPETATSRSTSQPETERDEACETTDRIGGAVRI